MMGWIRGFEAQLVGTICATIFAALTTGYYSVSYDGGTCSVTGGPPVGDCDDMEGARWGDKDRAGWFPNAWDSYSQYESGSILYIRIRRVLSC